ncbi:MAG: tetratricopeptide repeat protein [bacterium]
MPDKRDLNRDAAEFISRCEDRGFAIDLGESEGDVLAIAHSIPTLASIGRKSQAIAGARALMQARDDRGGWDDPLTSVIALEAFVALKLRAMDLPDGPQVVEYAVRYLRDTRPLDLLEHELRLSRSLVLAGLARQDAALIDAGLLRARSALENDPVWARDLDIALHGLLAVADLVTITRDATTEELISRLLSEHRLDSIDQEWIDLQTVSTLARAGTVLEKLGRSDAAMELYEKAVEKAEPSSLDTISLKFRVELGVRLFGDPEIEDNSDPEAKSFTSVETGEADDSPVNPVRFDELPAESNPNGSSVSAIILQQGSSESVIRTLEDLIAQTELPEQIVVLWNTGSTRVVLPDVPTDLAEVYGGSGWDESFWQLAYHAAREEWVWMIPSGVRILPDTLMMLKQSRGRKEALYLAKKEGDLDRAFSRLVAEPSLSVERCLLKRDLLNGIRFPHTVKSFWDIAASVKGSDVWREIPESGEVGIQSGEQRLDELQGVIKGLADHYRKFPVDGPEERKLRRDTFNQLRENLYRSFKEREHPLVSVILAGSSSSGDMEKTFGALLRNTQEIPFEVIAVLQPASDTVLRNAMLDAGVLIVPGSDTLTAGINKAATKAKGFYLVVLEAGVEPEEGWLQPLLSTVFQEANAGIVGGLVQSNAMNIQHAGIAFDNNSKAVYLHKGGPLVLSHIHKRRPYQAVAGGMVLGSKAVWSELHGLDDGFDDSVENAVIDFCLRAREKGVRVIYEPKAKATRNVQESITSVVHPHFVRKWRDRIVPDLELYARMDGYRVVSSKQGVRLVPIGPMIKGDKEATMDTSSASSTSHVIKIDETEVDHKENDLASLLTRAETLMSDGRFDIAEETLMQGQHQVNGNVSARVIYWTLLGDSKFRLNKTEDAYSCYKKAVKDDPSAERAWIGIATYHLVKGELDKAEDLFRRVIGLNDASTRGHLGLGNVCLRRGQPADALPNFIEASRHDPGYRPTIVGLVAAAVQSEQMQEALSPLQQYLQIHPEDNEARFHYAAILFGNQDNEHAKQEAMRVLQVKPDHQGARQLLDNLSRNRDAS